MKPRTKSASQVSPLWLNANSDQPLLRQIADHFRKQILSGALSDGHRLPTCLELGRTLGLAPQTVNRAFEVLAREGLVHRRRSLGTVVGRPSFENPEALPTKHRHRHAAPSVCLVMRRSTIPNEAEDIVHDYLNGLMEGFDAWKYRFEIAYLQPEQRDVDLVRAIVEQRQMRGLIHLGLNKEATDFLIEQRFPMVSLNQDLTASGVASVVADHVSGYAEAWQLAAKQSHGRVAFFGYDDHNAERRIRECRAGVKLAGVNTDLDHVALATNHAHPSVIWQTLEERLGSRSPGSWPTLFFAQNDIIASRLIRACHEHGVQVPRDVSVIGFDDSLLARHFHPAITTLSKPRFKMALAASRSLIDILAKRPGSADRLQVFPVQLVERETVESPTKK